MSASNAGSSYLSVPTISGGNIGEATRFSNWCGAKEGTTSGVDDPPSLRLYTEAVYRLTQIPTVLWADENALKNFFAHNPAFQAHEKHYRMLREATRFRWSDKLQAVLTSCLEGPGADTIASDIQMFAFKLQTAVLRRAEHPEIHNHPSDFADLGPAGPAIETLLARKLRRLLIYVVSAAGFQTIMRFGAYDIVEAEVRTNIDSIIRYFLNDDTGNIVNLQERTLNLPRFSYFDAVSKGMAPRDADNALRAQIKNYQDIERAALQQWTVARLQRFYGVSEDLIGAYADELGEDLAELLEAQYQRSAETITSWGASSSDYHKYMQESPRVARCDSATCLRVTPNFFTSRQVREHLTTVFADKGSKDRLTREFALVRLTQAEVERSFPTGKEDNVAPDSKTKRSDFLGRTVNRLEGQDIIGMAVFDAERRNAADAQTSDQEYRNKQVAQGQGQTGAPPLDDVDAYNGENTATNDALLIPILMGENKRLKLSSSFDVRGPNQERMYVFAGVRFLRLFGIHDMPVFGYISEGNTIAVSSAWSTINPVRRSVASHSTWIIERKTVVYQLNVPADALNFATFLAWIKHKHIPELREAIKANELEFLKFVNAALSKDPGETHWTQSHQHPPKKAS